MQRTKSRCNELKRPTPTLLSSRVLKTQERSKLSQLDNSDLILSAGSRIVSRKSGPPLNFGENKVREIARAKPAHKLFYVLYFEALPKRHEYAITDYIQKFEIFFTMQRAIERAEYLKSQGFKVEDIIRGTPAAQKAKKLKQKAG